MPFKNYLFLVLLLFNTLYCLAVENKFVSDSIVNKQSEIIISSTDSLQLADTISNTDSIKVPEKKKKDILEDKVIYSAEDSMIISISGQVLHLYGNANVKYTDIELKSNYIILDLGKKEVFAKGLPDTAGQVTGTPVFNQGNESFESDSMKYNFDTKKGIIYNIITKQGEGYFHSEKTKRLANEHINAVNNKYTTCDAKHPHFYLSLKKALVIPEDKIISGPAYMVVEDVPLPLIIPFGFFPNSIRRSSGVIIPTYESGEKMGMGLRDGGWYQVINDYADLTILGKYYTRGSWGINPSLAYYWKYHFRGNLNIDYSIYQLNDEPENFPQKNFAVIWSHSQDGKATPNQNFSANVNFKSRDNNRINNYNSYDSYTENTTTSSISYSRSWPNSGVNLTLNASATQNKTSNSTTASLPGGSFNVSTKYPFRKSTSTGKYKWYENISIAYQSQFKNTMTGTDSVILSKKAFDLMQTGFKQDIPVALNFKIGKMITLGPSFTYTGMLYTKHINKTYEIVNDTTVNAIDDTVRVVSYIHAIKPGASITFSPKIYGMFVSTKEESYVKAVRHVMSPTASFSIGPDMRDINPDYYEDLYAINSEQDTLQKQYNYSIYGREPYGVPSSPGKSGVLSLGLGNTLEMKVMPKNDTTGKPKKVILLKNLNFNTSYNPFADSLRWSPVSFSTGTSFFSNKLNINVNGSLDPYSVSQKGIRLNTYYIEETGKLFRLTSVSVTSGFTLKSAQGKKGKQQGQDQPLDNSQQLNDARVDEGNEMDFVPGTNSGKYVDYDIPWSLNVSYSWSYSKSGSIKSIRHSANFRGDLSITQKWKVIFNSGYDIEAKKVTYTTINFSRDLHCWEMSFGVVPFGEWRSYSFNIHAKSSLLQDLKYDLKPNTWYDKF